MLLVPVFQHLLLCLREGYSHFLQHVHLPLHGLAHHVAYAGGALGGGVQSVMLGYQVVHGGNEHVQTLLFAQEGGHLLGTHELNLVTHHAQLLLGGTQILYGLHHLVIGTHALPHDRLELRFGLHLNGVCPGQIVHHALNLAHGLLDVVHCLCRLGP